MTPGALTAIEAATKELGFPMASEPLTGALLSVLAASKPGGNLLEIGTGTGLSTVWLLAGMDARAQLTTIDSDAAVSAVARTHFGQDRRLTILVGDVLDWMRTSPKTPFDLVFADAMAGKYEGFEEAWQRLAPGGLYVIDDMLEQPNWPPGHGQKVDALIKQLDARADCRLVRMNWASGIIVAVRQ